MSNRRAYQNISKAKLKCISKGRGPGSLLTPQCLTNETISENIYVVDKGKNNVNTFTANGDFLFEFSANTEHSLIGPRCIFIDRNIIYVTDPFSNTIVMFTINGDLITQIKNHKEYGGALMNGPTGIAVDNEGSLFVANCIGNQILVATQEIPTFSVLLGRMATHWPQAIKIHKSMLIVMDNLSPCVAFFTRDGELLSRYITKGRGQQVWRPFSFDIDEDDRLLITDSENHYFRVFSPNGELIKTFSFKYGYEDRVVGIKLDNANRILTLQQSSTNILIIL